MPKTAAEKKREAEAAKEFQKKQKRIQKKEQEYIQRTKSNVVPLPINKPTSDQIKIANTYGANRGTGSR
jgi:hypothetical protein